MTDDMRAMRDDLAYLRGMAQGGAGEGAVGGAILVSAGLIWSVASFIQWAAIMGVAPITYTIANMAWMGGLLLFFACLFLITRQQKKRGGAATAGGFAWSGIGYALFSIFVAIALASYRLHTSLLISLSPAIVFALYGAAWSVAASLTGALWIRFTALGCFIATAICGWLVNEPVQWLVYGAGLLLLAALPGLVILRGARGGDSE